MRSCAIPAGLNLIRNLGNYPDYSGGRKWQPLQYSCLENLMDIGAWRATVHRVTKSKIELKQLTPAPPLY